MKRIETEFAVITFSQAIECMLIVTDLLAGAQLIVFYIDVTCRQFSVLEDISVFILNSLFY